MYRVIFIVLLIGMVYHLIRGEYNQATFDLLLAYIIAEMKANQTV